MPQTPRIHLVEVEANRIMRSTPAPHPEVVGAVGGLFPGYGIVQRESPTSFVASERIAVPMHYVGELAGDGGGKLSVEALGSAQARLAVHGGLIRTLAVSGELGYRQDVSQVTWLERNARPGTLDLSSKKFAQASNAGYLGRGLALGSPSGDLRLFAEILGDLRTQSYQLQLDDSVGFPVRVDPVGLRVVVVSGSDRRSVEIRALGQGWSDRNRARQGQVVLAYVDGDVVDYEDVVDLAEYLALRVLVARLVEGFADLMMSQQFRNASSTGLEQVLLSDAVLGPHGNTPAWGTVAAEIAQRVSEVANLDGRLERSWTRLRFLVGQGLSSGG